MKIEIDNDTIDDIVCATLKEHIKYASKNIKDLKAKQKQGQLKDFELQDLGHNTQMLASLKDVYGYFGGNL